MSKAIHNPALAGIEEHSGVSATFVVEPLHSGYGNTLGNSLRRVLLSSIRGGAAAKLRGDFVDQLEGCSLGAQTCDHLAT